MLVNRWVAWKRSCNIPGVIPRKFSNRMWRVCVTNLILQWKDPQDTCYDSPQGIEIFVGHEHQHLGKEWKCKCLRWLVCRFKTSIRDGLKLTDEGCTDARCKKNMVCSSNPGCNIMVHVHSSGENKRLIFNVPCFIEKTCFEIAHDDTFRGMIADTNNLASQ